ncbi:ABC transporter ATP-binding protein [Paracoccus sp. (in: a-proteobacteria)]|uniref:ABC transporter ATP-binding protein n=1 Tax=Paracoccus sp. TaxID=267 RepID=UPI003A89EAEE
MTTLKIDNVSRRFGGFTALDAIDIEAATGEFLTLLGPSGCGKSTLLSIIAGLDRPSGGAIVIDGEDVSSTLARDRDIAMIFQSYALYPNMTVAKNIAFGLKMRGIARTERDKAVHEIAQMLQIEPLLQRKPYQLSGGQRQRVAMGRALVRNPRLFLFDEPLSNLDAQLRSEMRIEIKRLHQKLGATIVYVTHDQVEAMTMSTRIVVMNRGKIAQIGTPSDVYGTPADLFVAKFVGSPAMNLIPGKIETAGQNVVLRVGSKALPLPAGPGLAHGQEITLGIRPEAFRSDQLDDGLSFDANIEVLEPTGADTLVIFPFGGVEITARVEPKSGLRPGSQAQFFVAPDAVHLFDTQTGLRIPPP